MATVVPNRGAGIVKKGKERKGNGKRGREKNRIFFLFFFSWLRKRGEYPDEGRKGIFEHFSTVGKKEKFMRSFFSSFLLIFVSL